MKYLDVSVSDITIESFVGNGKKVKIDTVSKQILDNSDCTVFLVKYVVGDTEVDELLRDGNLFNLTLETPIYDMHFNLIEKKKDVLNEMWIMRNYICKHTEKNKCERVLVFCDNKNAYKTIQSVIDQDRDTELNEKLSNEIYKVGKRIKDELSKNNQVHFAPVNITIDVDWNKKSCVFVSNGVRYEVNGYERSRDLVNCIIDKFKGTSINSVTLIKRLGFDAILEDEFKSRGVKVTYLYED